MTESSATRANDPSGLNIRTLEVTTQINGVATTVEMQVISIADQEGNVISLTPDRAQRDDIITEGRIHTEILLRLLSAATTKSSTREEILKEINQ